MERLSDRTIDIVNELHREHLDYNSEYVPLIDALQKLAAYEDCGADPEDVQAIRYAKNVLRQTCGSHTENWCCSLCNRILNGPIREIYCPQCGAKFI